ncbi:hypothetical protein [Streptomyces sp. CS147]|uniref:hypothetical protein n=1 Tax=Streptomyces TaxID=1883 RepID=UPI000D52460E|nr:hypothetical protein [Streptomyces sp. CS147]PVD10126.1 hypothetical protein DBP21_00095 [Streptomyces sp. CS147]
MPDVIEVSVSSTALFILMLAFAAVVGPPAASSVANWWSIRLRRWGNSVREAWARVVDRFRQKVIVFLTGGGGR